MAEKAILGIVFGEPKQMTASGRLEATEPLTEAQLRAWAHATMHQIHGDATNCHVTVFEHPSPRQWAAILAEYGAENSKELVDALVPGYPTAIVESDTEPGAGRRLLN